MQSKFLNKFKESVNISKNNLHDTSDSLFIEITNPDHILETMIKNRLRPVSWYYTIKKAIEEYNNGDTQYSSYKIKTDVDGKELEYVDRFRNLRWITDQDFQVGIPDMDRPLTTEEHQVCGDGFYGSDSNEHLYNPITHTMLRKDKPILSNIGMYSMYVSKKEPGREYNANRECKQTFTSLKQLLSSRNSKAKEEFLTNTFCGQLVVKRGKDEYEELFIPHSKYQHTTKYNKYLQTEKSGYYAKNHILVVDIDNGLQIDSILDSFNHIPFMPEEIIIEKGIGETKQGNASLIFIFDAPMLPEDRKRILEALKLVFCFQFNIYAIDRNATGTGFHKNPVKTYKGNLQRKFLIPNNRIYSENRLTNLDSVLEWANNIVCEYKEKLPAYIDKYISSKETLKRSTKTFSELFTMALDECEKSIKSECKKDKFVDEIFKDKVINGERNNTAISLISILCLQAYNYEGIDKCLADADFAMNIANCAYEHIQKTFDNSDYSISWKYVYNRTLWAIAKDRKAYYGDNPSQRNTLLRYISMQRTQIMKYKHHQLLDILGFDKESADNYELADIPELKEVNIDYSNIRGKYSKEQSKNGSKRQELKGIAYRLQSYNMEDYLFLLSYVLDYIDRYNLNIECEHDIRKLQKNLKSNIHSKKIQLSCLLKYDHKSDPYGISNKKLNTVINIAISNACAVILARSIKYINIPNNNKHRFEKSKIRYSNKQFILNNSVNFQYMKNKYISSAAQVLKVFGISRSPVFLTMAKSINKDEADMKKFVHKLITEVSLSCGLDYVTLCNIIEDCATDPYNLIKSYNNYMAENIDQMANNLLSSMISTITNKQAAISVLGEDYSNFYEDADVKFAFINIVDTFGYKSVIKGAFIQVIRDKIKALKYIDTVLYQKCSEMLSDLIYDYLNTHSTEVNDINHNYDISVEVHLLTQIVEIFNTYKENMISKCNRVAC